MELKNGLEKFGEGSGYIPNIETVSVLLIKINAPDKVKTITV